MKIFLILFTATFLVEWLIASLVGKTVLKVNNPWWKSMLAVLSANLVSYPIAWYVFSYASTPKIYWSVQYTLLVIEICVVLIEALLLKIQLQISVKQSLYIAFCMNLVSGIIGLVLWYI